MTPVNQIFCMLLVGGIGMVYSPVVGTAATFAVNSTADEADTAPGDGVCETATGNRVCTLRAAIQEVNAGPGGDTVTFDIAGSGVHIISPGTELPTIIVPVTIDGTTQPGASCGDLWGGIAPTWTVAIQNDDNNQHIGLSVTGGSSTIRGLSMGQFSYTEHAYGIHLGRAGGNTVVCNDIKATVIGVHIDGTAKNTIGGINPGQGNMISGNESGIVMSGSEANNNAVLGNFIGTNAAGNPATYGNGNGILLDNAPHNTIGGTSAGARNLISLNDINGIMLRGDGTTGNTVLGNFIGTNAAGSAAVSNAQNHVQNGVTIEGAPSNTIGGTTAAARNLVSGNNSGIVLKGSRVTGTTILGNFIGTDASGTAAVGNHQYGVHIDGAQSNTIGGTPTGARNVISGNNQSGILISGSGATGNTVLGNFIGTNAAGTAAVANRQSGVRIENAANNTIGGITAGAANVISGNTSDGVSISGSSATGNILLGNSIGPNAAGTAALGNRHCGVNIMDAPRNVVGGLTTAAHNIIVGNGSSGIKINGSGATGNDVLGNDESCNGFMSLLPAWLCSR